MKSEQVKELVEKGKTGWMDATDFQHELGNALGGNEIYPDEEDCRKNSPCINEIDPHPCVTKRVIVFDADELEAALEQAEREAVGQGGAELPSCEMCDAEITNNTVVCTNCWNRVAPLAAPRPEASTRELRERIEALPRYENGNLGMQTWPNGDWLSREAVLAKFEKEGK